MARGFNYAPGASAEVQEAMQPGLHKTHIMALGASRNSLVRTTVAARPDCPWGLMVTLAHDYSAEVRAAIARNPIAQRTVMAYLAADRNADVVKALLENPSLPAEILEELAFHKKKDVRAAAAVRLDAGTLIAVEHVAEDFHTPELAEHVVPVQERLTADGMAVPNLEPMNVVDLHTGAPVKLELVNAEPAHAEKVEEQQMEHVFHIPDVPPPTPAATPGWAPQIFSPHSTPDAPAPTRTAPVRGFKVRE